MIKEYPYNSTEKLSEHFKVSEFRCKCGSNHTIKHNPALTQKLEQLYKLLNCSKITVNSGHRCSKHDRAVGGSGYGQHVDGNAADIRCYDKDGKIISTKLVACKAQDVGFGGIANIDSTYTAIHVDVRTSNFWKGDEAVKGGTAHSVTPDFYSYYKIKRETPVDSSVSALQTALNASGGNLTVDGIMGEKTLAECRKHEIKKGDKGELVKCVQTMLSKKGYDCGTADGVAGDKTMQAIAKFKADSLIFSGEDWDKLIG